MELNLSDKIALVTAASQGLGKAAAIELAKEGCNLIICSSNKRKIEESARDIEKISNNKVTAVTTDLRDSKQIDLLFNQINSEYGGVDIVVNNAGGPPISTFDSVSDEDWQKAFELTMMSALRVSRLALPHMKEQQWGRIINISSYSVKTPVTGLFISNSIRLGVLGWAKALSDEVAKNGITVNTVCPGSTRTERIEQLISNNAKKFGKSSKEAEEAIATSIPMGRIGEPEELAALITFLASEKSSYMTGLAIQVDGGATREYY